MATDAGGAGRNVETEVGGINGSRSQGDFRRAVLGGIRVSRDRCTGRDGERVEHDRVGTREEACDRVGTIGIGQRERFVGVANAIIIRVDEDIEG